MKSYLKVKSVKSLGEQEVWDMEMPIDPNFLLPAKSGSIVAHNCKAHSIGYSKMGYATAYYKYYARAPFLCAYLNQEISKQTPATEDYISTIKKEIIASGIKIRACDINHSGSKYNVVDNKTIVTGLNAMKGIGEVAAQHVFANAPYSCFADFVYRSPSAVNKSAIIALAKAGAFDCWSISRKWFVDTFSDEKKGKKLRDRINKTGDKALANMSSDNPKEIDWSNFQYDEDTELMQKEFSRKEFLMHEKLTLGEFVSGSADEVYDKFFKKGSLRIKKSEASKMKDYSKITIEGILLSVDAMPAKDKNKPFGKLVIESLDKEDFEIMAWTKEWLHFKDRLVEGSPIIAECVVKRYKGNLGFSLNDVVDIWKEE